ncbi:uncharacterized protein LOC120644488 isoform X2 [Panicum virgatum]|uniref:uncharacterized protein LOC120644488 isoform X2 n=1 Tax=Panicum virgatum TaxID=38727 RepID=UPI0019D6731B|nr:uncharacterized protein LOC120644488 isoform X2 [Panicum virgatum]
MDPVPASPPVLRGMRTRRRAALRSVAAVGSSGRPRAVLRGVVARSGAALHGASRLSAAAAAEMRTGMRMRCCAKERWQGAAPRRRGAEAGCTQRAVEQGSSGRPRAALSARRRPSASSPPAHAAESSPPALAWPSQCPSSISKRCSCLEWISHLELGSWSRFCVNRTWFAWLLVSFLRNSVFLCVLLEQGGGGRQVCGMPLVPSWSSICLE